MDASAGRGGVVLVAGEAGVGKSRLIAEFRGSLTKSRVRVAVGQCLEFAQRPYGPVLDALARFDPEHLDLVPAASKVEQFDAIVERFSRAASRAALVAIFEDLHWADAATMELLAYLATRLDTLRLLVVVSYRPERLEGGDAGSSLTRTIARARRVGRIDLQPLSGPELRRFIDEALSGIDLAAETRRAVARTSEGNPFFTEELLKSAVEQAQPSVRTATGRHLPGTIRATVMERLQPLDENDRRILAQASVIGRRFPLGILCETVDDHEDAVLAALQRARDLQLVDEESGESFRFRHALTREAIYGGFLTAQVRPLHRKIALVLGASNNAGDHLASLAYHWWAAGDRERGARYNELAGDAAGAVFAHEDAIAAYERALQLVDKASKERAMLLEKIAVRRGSIGLAAAAQNALTEAADILQRLGDLDGEARYRVLAAQDGIRTGVPGAIVPLEALLARLPPEARVARIRLHLQLAYYEGAFKFRHGEAVRHLAEVDEEEVSADVELTRIYHSTSALVHCVTGDVAALRSATEKALVASQAASHTDWTVMIQCNAGMELLTLGLRDEARSHFYLARELAVAIKNRNLEAHIDAMSANMRYLDGDLDGVRNLVTAAAALRSDSAIVMAHCAAWGTLAGLALGDDRLVEEWFDNRRGALSHMQLEYFAAGYAEVLARRGRLHEAQRLLRDAIADGDTIRGISCTLLAVARIGHEADFERARSLLVAASHATVDMLERPALSLFDALVERRAGRSAAAAAHARKAVGGFRDHRTPLLEAAALEVAGDVGAALAIYHRLGAAGEVRRINGRSEPLEVPSSRTTGERSALSKREDEIASLVAQGFGNLHIAQHLSISHKTVEKHLGTVYQKLGFSSRAQLAAWITRSRERDI
ncbi:MAG: AAA family ATPase [Candidatus Eremiobacteraeota bacterium]|nr:AAA family ATPase [Candidatus Eremiobacteraeota bacterium]